MKHILMVDDAATNLRMAAEVLQPYYRLSMAKSGKQALKFLEKNIPDLILLDIKMPEMDGYQVLERIRLNPKTAAVPIIFLTADTETESEIRGIQMGAIDFITKPFAEDVMLARIEKVLQMEDMKKNLLSFGQNNQDTLLQNRDEAIGKIDHTLLKAFASMEDIWKLCEEAILYHTASVCIPPSYVGRVKEKYRENLTVCTVIGFPLGYSTTKAKVAEARCAVEDGADEIDMVINIGDVKNGEFEKILDEILQIRQVCTGKILKVIIETCYLTEDEKIRMCEIVTQAKADYIKTSTGFGTGGATLKDIALMKAHIGSQVKIKAAGGIRTKQALADFIAAGCDRIGSSSTKEFMA